MEVVDSDVKFEKGAILIQKAGNKLGCSCIVISKALMIYHHFRRVTAEIEYSDFTIAAAVLDTSIFKNTGRNEFKDVVLTFHEFMCKEKPDQEKDKPSEEEILAMKDDFTRVQYFIMQTLEFNIDYVVAHSFAGRYLTIFRERPELNDIWEHFLEFVWKFISQFYLSKRCLQYSAQEISFGCITLAAKVLIVDLSAIPNWTQESAVHMDNKKQQDIFDDLLYVLDILT